MSDQLITPADAEQAVIDELTPHFTVVGTSIPAGDVKPDLFIRVVAVGGAQRDLVTDEPLVTIEAFARRETLASEVAREALARVELAVRKGRLGGVPCSSMRVSALPQNFPLPSVPTHRRYITTIAPALRRRVTTL